MPGPLPIGLPWKGDFPDFAGVDSSKSFHAYLHIPFCEVRCGYCDFNTYTADEVQGVKRADFHESLSSEITQAASRLKTANLPERRLSTVFFGGGTPSLFEPVQIQMLIRQLSDSFGINQDAEITLEVNPDSVDEEYLLAVAELGVTRVSIGAQSFDREVLGILDRTHDPENVEMALNGAKKAGMQVSLDLIYGTPSESLQSWERTLTTALDMQPDHLSAYALIVEQGTKLARQVQKGVFEQPDDDLMAEKYELLDSLTKNKGLSWYELSNFSRDLNSQSTHNRAYWLSNHWYGFGPGAHSFIGNLRFWNRKHPAAYRDSLQESLPIQGYEEVAGMEHLQERLLLEIRLSEGVEKALLDDLGVNEQLRAEQVDFGYLVEIADRYQLTLKGRQMADRVVLNLLN